MAQRVEFFVKVRVFKDKNNESEEDKAARIAKRLIKGDKYEEDEEDEDDSETTYKPLVVNLNDIVAYGKEDDEHVKIFLNYGMFLIRMGYEKFSRIYEELSGELIKRIK